MPKENKHSRGRREEKKLKRKRDNGEEEPVSKRQKSEDPADDPEVQILGTDDAIQPDGEEGGTAERPFYGMLEDEEQEYFRRADEMLDLNDFPSPEDRSLFLANVYREAEGKELKIACSQSCSRLMERLILLSTVEQKKKLFEKFAGNFPHLIQHRFSSHCCETLFIQSAPVVTEELTADYKKEDTEEEETKEVATMESLFLQTLDELEGQMTFLLTDRFASHTLRVLLVILSGRPLEKSSTRTLLQSKKKEKITVTGYDSTPTELSLNKRAVPSSFQFAVDKIISDTIATMDQSFIRILATHPTGNPTLQLLLELELINPNSKKDVNADQKTIISALLPDDITTENSESATFVNGILYDAIGSRLLETICAFAPGKLFKQIYRTVFKDRIAAIARNEISSYVAMRVLNRISKEDLEEAVTAINPQILGLVQRNRTMIIKTLIERCQARGVETVSLTASIAAAYDSDPSTLVLKMACIDDISSLNPAPVSITTDGSDPSPTPTTQPKSTPSQLHGSLLAQSMLSIPGPPATLIQKSLLALPHETLLTLATYTTTSHILQTALLPTLSNTIPFRRKIINTLLFPSSPSTTNPILHLALSPTGSHVLDALLTSTCAPTATHTSAPLFILAERIASSLLTHEHELRDSFTGRIVVRNWSLDLFKRRRGDWVKKVKAAGAEAVASLPSSAPTEELPEKKDKKKKKNTWGTDVVDPTKSAIQLAREKFAVEKAMKGANQGGRGNRGSGANAGVVVASK
ncbi:ARM repeat-containing protein [Mollisia scopiformis]|uniref:Nucleolar protein 9 n=1 Tax=Mollisia scopiformis TaxID=149040 RepID=A0A194WRX4_MOLSC|nr:ARM repeat-containing protein [Mollisia scopiformis]KUJ10733.1 ARM repeat-containing protein [Mollisia scopiformis]